MSTVTLELDDIYKLAHDVMLANGCDSDNAAALADIISVSYTHLTLPTIRWG